MKTWLTQSSQFNIPRGLTTLSARTPALFLPDPKAAERFFDFFTANIRNKNTRRAYYKAACRFAEWCEANGLHDLAGVKPFHVAAYVEGLGLAKRGKVHLLGNRQWSRFCESACANERRQRSARRSRDGACCL